MARFMAGAAVVRSGNAGHWRPQARGHTVPSPGTAVCSNVVWTRNALDTRTNTYHQYQFQCHRSSHIIRIDGFARNPLPQLHCTTVNMNHQPNTRSTSYWIHVYRQKPTAVFPMLVGWVNPHRYREQQTIPQGQTSSPPKSYFSPPTSWIRSPTSRCDPSWARRVLAFTRYCNAQYCVVHSVKTGGRRGVVYCPIVAQWYCTRVGNADDREEWKDGWFVQKSLEVNEYLAKAKPCSHSRMRLLIVYDSLRAYRQRPTAVFSLSAHSWTRSPG